MEDTLWIEIADAPGEIFEMNIKDFSEIFDIPDMWDEEEEDPSFNVKLNSNFDF